MALLQATPEQIFLIKSNSPNFSPEELMCPCCGRVEMRVELLTKLQALRNYMKIPLTINSGFRCRQHNITVKGKSSSRHLIGEAVDISLELERKNPGTKGSGDIARSRHKFVQMAMHLFTGIGLAETFVHCDVRQAKALWHY